MQISGNTCLTRGGAVWLTSASASGGSADRNVLVLVEGVGVTFLRVEDVGIASVILAYMISLTVVTPSTAYDSPM